MAVGMTHVARGTRGDYDPTSRPGDLTGRIATQQAGAREDRDRAIKATRDALAGGNEPLEIVSIPGGRSFAIPRELVTHLLRVGAEEAD
jgi:hypothetical protein